MKMIEFRSTHPLSDEELASIRTNVLSTITTRNSRRWMPIVKRFVYAAAIVIAVITRWNGPKVRDERPQNLVPAVVAPVANKPAIIETARVSIPQNAPIPTPHPIVRAVYRSKKHHPLPHPEYQTIRMEIRTADPDVRIIWIANQKNATTTTGGNS